MSSHYSGNYLMSHYGLQPGPFLGIALSHLNSNNLSREEVDKWISENRPEALFSLRSQAVDANWFIPESLPKELELELDKKIDTIFKMPNIVSGDVMPNASPLTTLKGIAVKAVDAIFPELLSSDIACGLSYCRLGKINPAIVFGIAKKKIISTSYNKPEAGFGRPSLSTANKFSNNAILKTNRTMIDNFERSFGVLGPSAHFFMVAVDPQNEDTYLVVHSGTKQLGSELHLLGSQQARRQSEVFVRAPYPSFIETTSPKGNSFYSAMLALLEWNVGSHEEMMARVIRCLPTSVFNNAAFSFSFCPHNFVFKKGKYFLHCNGVNYLDRETADGMGIISQRWLKAVPMFLGHGEPIQLVLPSSKEKNKGTFASENLVPHGLGRIMPHYQTGNLVRRLIKGYHSDKELHPSRVPQVTFEETRDYIASVFKNLDVHSISKYLDPAILPEGYNGVEEINETCNFYNMFKPSKTLEPYGVIFP